MFCTLLIIFIWVFNLNLYVFLLKLPNLVISAQQMREHLGQMTQAPNKFFWIYTKYSCFWFLNKKSSVSPCSDPYQFILKYHYNLVVYPEELSKNIRLINYSYNTQFNAISYSSNHHIGVSDSGPDKIESLSNCLYKFG